MKLVSSTDPILLRTADPVIFPDRSLTRTISDMLQLMLNERGCGLAAPQVGLPLRLFTFKVGSNLGVIINPIILDQSPEQIDFVEGCLTFPGRRFRTKRAKWVLVRFQDMMGNLVESQRLDGLMAIVYTHETDHLNGRLVSQHGSEVTEE